MSTLTFYFETRKRHESYPNPVTHEDFPAEDFVFTIFTPFAVRSVKAALRWLRMNRAELEVAARQEKILIFGETPAIGDLFLRHSLDKPKRIDLVRIYASGEKIDWEKPVSAIKEAVVLFRWSNTKNVSDPLYWTRMSKDDLLLGNSAAQLIEANKSGILKKFEKSNISVDNPGDNARNALTVPLCDAEVKIVVFYPIFYRQ